MIATQQGGFPDSPSHTNKSGCTTGGVFVIARPVKPIVVVDGIECKLCNSCREMVPLSNYYKSKANKDGLCTTCKSCSNKTHNQYAKKNSKKINKQARQRYKVNPLGRLLSNAKSRKNHLEQVKLSKKIWYEKNAQKVKDNIKKWSKTAKGKESRRIQWNKRYSMEKGVESTFTVEQWEKCKQYFNNKCAYCGEEKPLQQDHFIPLSSNGGYTVDNIVPACQRCNFKKNRKDPFIWYKEMTFYSKQRELKILTYLNYNTQQQALF